MLFWLACGFEPTESDSDHPAETEVADSDVDSDVEDTDTDAGGTPLTACPAYSGIHSTRTHLVQSLTYHAGMGKVVFDREVIGATGDLTAPIVEVWQHEIFSLQNDYHFECEGTFRVRCDPIGLWLLTSDFDCTTEKGAWNSDTEGYDVQHAITYVDWGDGLLLVPADGLWTWDVAVTAAWTMDWTLDREPGFGFDSSETILGTTDVDATFEASEGTIVLGGVDTPVRSLPRDPLTDSHQPALGWWWGDHAMNAELGPIRGDYWWWKLETTFEP